MSFVEYRYEWIFSLERLSLGKITVLRISEFGFTRHPRDTFTYCNLCSYGSFLLGIWKYKNLFVIFHFQPLQLRFKCIFLDYWNCFGNTFSYWSRRLFRYIPWRRWSRNSHYYNGEFVTETAQCAMKVLKSFSNVIFHNRLLITLYT